MKTKLGKLLKKEFGDKLNYIKVEDGYLDKNIFHIKMIVNDYYCGYTIIDKRIIGIDGMSDVYKVDRINKVLSECFA